MHCIYVNLALTSSKLHVHIIESNYITIAHTLFIMYEFELNHKFNGVKASWCIGNDY